MSRPDGVGEVAARAHLPHLPPGTSGSTCWCDRPPQDAAPAAEADLRAELVGGLRATDGTSGEDVWVTTTIGEFADAVLALPALQRLVEQAAEAAQLRKTVARVRSMRDVATANTVTTAALDWALDGTDG